MLLNQGRFSIGTFEIIRMLQIQQRSTVTYCSKQVERLPCFCPFSPMCSPESTLESKIQSLAMNNFCYSKDWFYTFASQVNDCFSSPLKEHKRLSKLDFTSLTEVRGKVHNWYHTSLVHSAISFYHFLENSEPSLGATGLRFSHTSSHLWAGEAPCFMQEVKADMSAHLY